MPSFVRSGLLAAALASSVSAASAEPIKLKLAYFSSDRTTTYLAMIKPFVDAVNARPRGCWRSRCISAARSARIRRSN